MSTALVSHPSAPASAVDAHLEALADLTQPVACTINPDGTWQTSPTENAALTLPAISSEQLGSAAFRQRFGLRYAYMAGAMANGIASAELVIAAGQAGFLGSFGAGGLPLPVIDESLTRIRQTLGNTPFACNLLHAPNEPALEDGAIDLFMKHHVRIVEASAYLQLTHAIVRYRLLGARRTTSGIELPNKVIAKVSRVEVATRFAGPPPQKIVDELLAQGAISAEEAACAPFICMSDAVTAEADSGGHTDNRPAFALFPQIVEVVERTARAAKVAVPDVGLGGGIGTPESAAAAFALGAAFIVTGSVNQACIESGSSDRVRELLRQVEQADVTMAPAADMFEMGVKLQVIKRGTMFPMRAQKLYELYRNYDSIEAIPTAERQQVEKTIFRTSMHDIWNGTKEFFNQRDPRQVAKAEADPKHKLALVCRWYLGLSSQWANRGVDERAVDYQIWAGPALGAFNAWTANSHLDEPKKRTLADVALNILRGAAILGRVNALRSAGATVNGVSQITRPEVLA